MSDLNEARTRETLIDPALARAGWDMRDRDQVRIEVPVDGFDPRAWAAFREQATVLREPGVPYSADGDILAIVEAKRERVDPRLLLHSGHHGLQRTCWS